MEIELIQDQYYFIRVEYHPYQIGMILDINFPRWEGMKRIHFTNGSVYEKCLMMMSSPAFIFE